jgi:hypothetical protein
MMHKLLIVVLLGALIGMVAWDISTHASTPKTRVDSQNFIGITCPSCDRLFYVEKNQQEGWCPYDGVRFDFISGT